eukprot:TRINITY_DN105147_c0_g1_i1.p1 TRINITY_DN105147_c0_g1~~TRINITY_DN105147_c0_g1_i1.p1  ORF type:complete len:407 (+),score=71.32 TRINITY_DN105147_c0_g1_i1:70-1290(+)
MSADTHSEDLQLMCKWVRGEKAGDSILSYKNGVQVKFEFFQAREDGWVMVGHSVDNEHVLMVDATSKYVKNATRFQCYWSNEFSGAPKDCAVYMPEASDPDYEACGAFFSFGVGYWEYPTPDLDLYPVGLVHKSLLRTVGEHQLKPLWTAEGTGARYNIRLKTLPQLGLALPVDGSLLPTELRLVEILPSVLFTAGDDAPEAAIETNSIKFRVRNTFIHFDVSGMHNDEEEEQEQAVIRQASRRSSSAPLPIIRYREDAANNEIQPSVVRASTDTKLEAEVSRTAGMQSSIALPEMADKDDEREEEEEQVAMKPKPSATAELGSAELPTIGSVCHGEGCKPCVFQSSCANGTACQFCHLCEPKLKKRGRWNLKRRKNKAELEMELAKRFGPAGTPTGEAEPVQEIS